MQNGEIGERKFRIFKIIQGKKKKKKENMEE